MLYWQHSSLLSCVTPAFPFCLWLFLLTKLHDLWPLIWEMLRGSVLLSPLTYVYILRKYYSPSDSRYHLYTGDTQTYSSQDFAAQEIQLFTEWLHVNEYQESTTHPVQATHWSPLTPVLLLRHNSSFSQVTWSDFQASFLVLSFSLDHEYLLSVNMYQKLC